MARYDVIELEGMRFVRITLEGDMVRTERRALAHMRGTIQMRAPLPGLGEAIRCAIGDQSLIRPSYEGTGEINLHPSMGGYHIFELAGDSWVLERGAYWASDGSVTIGIHRDPMLTALWAGDGLIHFQLKVAGHGRVVLNAYGPVREIVLDGQQITVDGRLVIARTSSLRYRVRRATTNIIGHFLAGQGWMRTYAGSGKVLLCASPYWQRRLLGAVAGEPEATAR
jgi:uncharacterized protein (AIM24 family)